MYKSKLELWVHFCIYMCVCTCVYVECMLIFVYKYVLYVASFECAMKILVHIKFCIYESIFCIYMCVCVYLVMCVCYENYMYILYFVYMKVFYIYICVCAYVISLCIVV